MILWKVRMFLFLILLSTASLYAQDEITETIDDARKLYLQNELAETVSLLDHALELVNDKLLAQLESLFPKPLKGWRADKPLSHIKKNAYGSGLIAKKKYYKKGGGASVGISLETNASRMANIKMIFVNPARVKQVGDNAKTSMIAELRCIETYDPVDKFAELIFIPGSSLLISIRGYDMKNTKIVTKYAENINWDHIGDLFP